MAQTSASQAWQQPTALTHRVASALQSVWAAYWAHKAERATALILHSLDDRTLKDIGMDRSEIESVAHNPGRERRIGPQTKAIQHRRHSSMCA
jgi:uncharacterized protein YjiS (DUF1127 family)